MSVGVRIVQSVLGLLACACGGTSCPESACFDQVVLELSPPLTISAESEYQFVMSASGETITCTLSVPRPPEICPMPGPIVHAGSPDLLDVLIFRGIHSVVEYSFSRDGEEFASGSFMPKYRTIGRSECDQTCRQAPVQISLAFD